MADVLTSENSAEFYANKLGLAEDSPTEAVETEPVAEIEQSEPVVENEEKATEEPKPKVKMRFDEVTNNVTLLNRKLNKQESEHKN